MRRVWTLAAAAAATLAVPAARAHALPAVHADGDAAAREGSVTAVSVVPSNSRAEVVVAVDSSVTVQDFVLESPSRIVLDLSGATLGMPPRFYDKIARGGVKNVRFAQYKSDVVRVVIELDGTRKYTLTQSSRDIRVSVEGAGASFAPWHTSAPLARVGGATVQTVAAPATPAAAPERAATASEAPSVAEASFSSGTTLARASVSPTQAQQQSTQPRITVTYQDADIRDVLAAFAAFSGRTIVVGKAITGTVTAEIRDQPWDVALQAILQSQGLAAAEDQYGIIAVDSYQNIAAKQSSEPLVTQLVAVNYANANSLVQTISSLLAKDCGGGAGASGGTAPVSQASCIKRGNVVADTATNTLLITEVPSRINEVINYVKDLDVRTPQVAIKAKIIFVARTDVEQLGISYDLGTSGQFFNTLLQRPNPTSPGTNFSAATQVISIGGDALSAISNASRPFQASAALSLIYSTMIGKFSLTGFLDALQEVRLSDTQAEPNIVTLDNRLATILVGEETPIRVVDAASAGTGQAPRANVTFKESGIILNVTPHITNNRQILMAIHAEQSQLQAAAADIGFTFLKRRADTQLLVNDGETAVLGGLTITQITTSKSGIPFLVDLPLLGRLFGATSTQESKQDLLILITPHIVDEGEAVRSSVPR